MFLHCCSLRRNVEQCSCTVVVAEFQSVNPDPIKTLIFRSGLCMLRHSFHLGMEGEVDDARWLERVAPTVLVVHQAEPRVIWLCLHSGIPPSFPNQAPADASPLASFVHHASTLSFPALSSDCMRASLPATAYQKRIRPHKRSRRQRRFSCTCAKESSLSCGRVAMDHILW